MITGSRKAQPESVLCEVCRKEVPKSEAAMAETMDHVAYFCGPDCYGKWSSQRCAEAGRETSDSIARWAAEHRQFRRVWLYGSPAKGTHRPDSDINIAVELEPVGDSEETLAVWIANAGSWQLQLQTRIAPKVDLEWFDPDGSTRTLQAAQEEAKVLIYERAG